MTYDRAVELEPAAAAPARSRWRRLRPGDWAVRVGSIVLVLGVWELFGPSLNKLILRPPSAIFAAFFELVENGELQAALGQSLRELVGGLAIALVLGIVLGIASGRWRFVYNALDPLVSALYSVPSVALVPLIAVAFRSIGDAPRIATVALFAIFPILINTQQGVRNVDRQLLEVARAFNTSERRLWTDVIVPAAVPYVLAATASRDHRRTSDRRDPRDRPRLARARQRVVIITMAAAAHASPTDCTGCNRSRNTTLASSTVLAG